MRHLHELTALVPPPAEAPPPVDWDAAHAALGFELPADYRALVDRYGGGSIAELRVLVPGHPNPHADLLRQIEQQRWALRYMIEGGEEWYRYDGGAVAFIVAILTGRAPLDFLVIGGDAFEPFVPAP